MSTPVLELVAGPNGAGKTTFVDRILEPRTHLPFVNAHRIGTERWLGEEEEHAYAASDAADLARRELMATRTSFIAETVFSHPSKRDLAVAATAQGYLVHLHVLMCPVEVSIARVAQRVIEGGHSVPEQKIRERHDRLWTLVAEARATVEWTTIYDTTSVPSFRRVARYRRGTLIESRGWPAWTPTPLLPTAA